MEVRIRNNASFATPVVKAGARAMAPDGLSFAQALQATQSSTQGSGVHLDTDRGTQAVDLHRNGRQMAIQGVLLPSNAHAQGPFALPSGK